MKVLCHVNEALASNTYLLYNNEEDGIWIIDPGDEDCILEWLEENHSFLKGILVTHAHFDHIYGINLLLRAFPRLSIYCSQKAKEGMMSSKINCSYYTDNPFVISRKATIYCIEDNDIIYLWNHINAVTISTPGHNNDCVSFLIENNLFTGDAFIPGVKAYSKKIKGGDEIEAMNSQNRIFSISSESTSFFPGHGKIFTSLDVKLANSFTPVKAEKGFR